MLNHRITVAITCMLICIVVVGAISYAASWSSEITLTLPAFNGSSTSSSAVLKTTNDTTCSFYTSSVTGNATPDARLLNSNGESRSNWARNLSTGTYSYATTTASKGYGYYAQVSSDLTQITNQSIRFKFSPDNLTE
jgi:hypothetical protein